jgi:hypothetical protein
MTHVLGWERSNYSFLPQGFNEGLSDKTWEQDTDALETQLRIDVPALLKVILIMKHVICFPVSDKKNSHALDDGSTPILLWAHHSSFSRNYIL